jgi:type I site-specific restriction-modification system R (restriction) subunit
VAAKIHYSEDTLVQQTTAEYLEQELGWVSVYAYNNEYFGPDSLLGRESDREVVLTRTLRCKIEELNPGLPATAYDDAVRQIVTVSASQTMAATNREKYELIKDGVQVTFRNAKGERVRQRLRVFDFDVPESNHFLCVRELWVRGDLYRRRADIVGFVNGLPLLFMELKNVSKDIRAAYEQNFLDYKDTVPHLFHHNAMVVLANGVDAKLGSLTSRFEHFHEWKRLAENQPGVVAMETLLKGVCAKAKFLDLVENFIVFDDSAGNPRKILARNHQFLGVNRAIAAVRDRKLRNGKLGVFWHTQGSGKSYSMVLFTRKVHRKLGGNFTFLILTDRDDLDKPLKAHTLMQAIAGANRVNEGKNNGMIVDYCGILKNLRKALATFAGTGDDGRGGDGGETEPAKPDEELLADLREAIAFVRSFLAERSASLDGIIRQTGFARNAAILAAKEAANENDETRKRFEVMCRAVFSKFKACITIEGVNDCRGDFDAINIVYKSLQQDREQADITDIIRQLHQVVDEAIETQTQPAVAEESPPYDISKIDFDRLRREFERSPAKRTTVQNLKTAIEQRLQRLLQQNPLRTDFQRHYEEIVAEYNREKDRVTIEKTFEALLQIMDEMDDEESRAVREGLDEESLAVFDLLRKPDLTSGDIKRIKAVAIDLLETLKAEKLRINHWRDKESTRDAVRLTIQDYLWSEQTGLPETYSEEDVRDKTEAVFVHVFRAYPTVPSPYYEMQAV